MVGYTSPSGDSFLYAAPDTVAPTGCPTPPPTSGEWKLANVECVTGSVTDSIDFTITYPIEGSAFVFAHVEDSVVGTYSCASISTPNQIFCLGARPPASGTVDLLAQATYFDAVTLTHSFPEWPSLLPKGSCILPTTTPPCSSFGASNCPASLGCKLNVNKQCVPK